MTGSGTQADPYIVSSWSEFTDVMGSSGSYIKFADGGGTIDFNEVQPSGFTSPIVIYAFVDLNGWVWKNARFTGQGRFEFHLYVRNGSIVDIYAEDMVSYCLYFYTSNVTQNMKISGVYYGQNANNSELFFLSSYGSYGKHTFNACSFNVEVYGNNVGFTTYSASDSSYNAVLQDCNMKVKIKGTTSAYLGRVQLENTLISGSIAAPTINRCGNACVYSILDMEINQTVTSGTASSICLYNNEKATFSGISNMVGVSSTQLRNAEYLRSLGFPIGVD